MDQLVTGTQPARVAFHEAHRELMIRLAEQGQFPKVMFIGCNDSRVLPEAITGARPGDLFVSRTVANIVPPCGSQDRASGATIEFAVGYLKVRHIIICGHTDCGGIKALDLNLDRQRDPHLVSWIEYARPAQQAVDARHVGPELRHLAIVEHNVLAQLANVASYPAVARAVEAGWLTLHGWVYHLMNGRIHYWDRDAGRFVDEAG